jgi:hypothetical protein
MTRYIGTPGRSRTSLLRTVGARHNRLIRRNGTPPIIVAGMLGHSLAILMTTYAHYIPGTQDEAARVMDDILTPIPIDLKRTN